MSRLNYDLIELMSQADMLQQVVVTAVFQVVTKTDFHMFIMSMKS